MANPPEKTGGLRRFVINVVGVIGLVFGAIPIVRYLFDSSIFDFTDAPYRWLQLEGTARFLPPVLVLIVCLAVAFWLERRDPDA